MKVRVRTLRPGERWSADDDVRAAAIAFGCAGLALAILVAHIVGQGLHHPAIAVIAFLLLLTAPVIGFAAWERSRRVWLHVYPDGVRVGETFVPLSDVARVELVTQVGADGLRLWRQEGPALVVYARPRDAASVVVMVQSQLDEAADRELEREAAYLVGRRSRDVAAWVRRARGALGPGEGLRSLVDPSALWRLVEDTTARPSIRAGAAMALGATSGAPTRARLRVIAAGAASPLVRAACNANDDETAWLAALEEAAHAEDGGRRRSVETPV
jgi:hypothetical protein